MKSCIGKIKSATLFLVATAGLSLVALLGIGVSLTHPRQVQIGPPPADLPATSVAIPSASGSTLSGWLLPGDRGAGAVLLMHGVRANRLAMLARARFLHTAGYAVLLFDFQAHGESPGQRITFGYLESFDASAAVDFLRQQIPDERIGAIGVSLGGVATVLSPTRLPVDALILESVYPTFEEAIADRLRLHLGQFGLLLTPLWVLQMQWQFGLLPQTLRPIDRIGNIRTPVFVIAGAEDQHTTIAESRRLFAAAPAPKEWWEIPGAAHVDLHRFTTRMYEERVLAFFHLYLRGKDHRGG